MILYDAYCGLGVFLDYSFLELNYSFLGLNSGQALASRKSVFS